MVVVALECLRGWALEAARDRESRGVAARHSNLSLASAFLSLLSAPTPIHTRCDTHTVCAPHLQITQLLNTLYAPVSLPLVPEVRRDPA